MSPDAVITAWLDGGDVDIVAPFVAIDEIAAWSTSRGVDAILVAASDADALLAAATSGLNSLLRTTSRAERDRWYARPVGRRGCLVTSVDSLHSPVLQSEVAREAAGLPWAILDADRLSPVHPQSAGRGAWVAVLHAACLGGGLSACAGDCAGITGSFSGIL